MIQGYINTGTRIITAAMRTQKQTLQQRLKSLLMTAAIFGFASEAIAADVQMLPVNIFGDGDPANGVEDDRRQLLGGHRRGDSLADQRMNAGTIKCDGKVRGTAMVIDTREFAPGLKGAVLASDAFFPFADNIDEAHKAGITAIIQPGGSKKDDEVIACANKHGIAMVFTGKRHFKH